MFTEEKIFNDAWVDNYAVKIDGYTHKSVFLYGVKISKSKDENLVTIENIGSENSNYISITEHQRSVFQNHGWRKGVYSVALHNLEKLVDKYHLRIHKEKDESKKKEYLNTMEKYKSKLNKIKEKNERI